ncbi:MAG: NAD(P)/FAD-dependent oxidoreductase [Oleispira sp.]|nr:NAD(P)/FAD-dependent oxidoreductase [Oleispira sp.]
MTKKQLVIIGNGLATMQLLKELDHQQDYLVTVLSAENVPHYNRIMLSSLLAQETDLQSITPCDDDWYQERNVRVLLNHRVIQVDSKNHILSCENGAQIPFDKLIFATGSRAFIPPMPGTQMPAVLDGVMGFRKLIDVDFMQEVTSRYKQAVVIGAGLLGIEAAVGLAKQGMDVTLLHRRDVLMNRQIDRKASDLLITELEGRGIKIATGHGPIALIGTPVSSSLGGESASGKVVAVELDNGDKVDADLVIFATGIVPCTPLAQASGLMVKKGICVDAQLQTSQADIYALGECCEFEGNTYGLVAPIWNQARVLAMLLLLLAKRPLAKEALDKGTLEKDDELPVYQEESFATKLKVSGIDVHSMGIINIEETDLECEVLEFNDSERSIYKKILISDHKVVGAVLYGDVADSQWYFELLQQELSIKAFRQNLIFGKAFCDQ